MASFLAKNPEASKKSNLPVRSLFLPRLEFDKTDNSITISSTAIPKEWPAMLNNFWLIAVSITAEKNVSMIYRHLAMGKSEQKKTE